MPDDIKISLAQQLQEAEREFAISKSVYPSLVARKKMKESEMKFRLAAKGAIIGTLRWLRDNEAAVRAAVKPKGGPDV